MLSGNQLHDIQVFAGKEEMEMVRYQKIDDVMEYTLLAWLGVGNFVTRNILEAPNRNNVTNAIYKNNGREDLQ